MNYAIRIKRSAAKELARISRRDRLHIEWAINSLKEHPLSGSLLKGKYELALSRVSAEGENCRYAGEEVAEVD